MNGDEGNGKVTNFTQVHERLKPGLEFKLAIKPWTGERAPLD